VPNRDQVLHPGLRRPETLLLGLPEGPCGVSFRVLADAADVDRRGGILRLTGEIRRSVVYTTNGAVLENKLPRQARGSRSG
jgi:hypothetical protein